jgi:hypothetical protein
MWTGVTRPPKQAHKEPGDHLCHFLTGCKTADVAAAAATAAIANKVVMSLLLLRLSLPVLLQCSGPLLSTS